MPRESIITVLRSTTTDTPTGMTFGEMAYSDLNGKLFVGRDNGASLWIGAGVTDGSISNNSQYLLPTQSAVKTYVDGIVGGGSVVNSLNNASGNIVVTGDGGAIIKNTSSGTNTFTARIATASLTGVAAFPAADFTINTGSVFLKDVVRSFNGATGAVTYSPVLASTSLTGVASFNSTYFSVNGSGQVSLASAYQVTGDTVSAGTGIQTSRSGNTVTVTNAGVKQFQGLTGTFTINGGGAINIVQTAGVGDAYTYQLTARNASTSVTGVASFNGSDFTVSAAGAVSINTSADVFNVRDSQNDTTAVKYGGTLTITGGNGVETDVLSSGLLTVRGATATATTAGVARFPTADFTINTGSVFLKDTVRSFNGATGAVTYSPRIATTSLTGEASFQSADFTVSAAGAVALKDVVRSFNGVTGAVTYSPVLASTSVTGVASFNSTHFTVNGSGQVSSNGVTVKASGADTGSTLNLGGTLTITGAANQIRVTRSTTEFTVGLPDDVTIPGNLTVNGTVVTANVDNFVVEDPLFMLGTGNAADSVDLGFYSLYTSSGAKYAGLFRDASDSGKFKLFTGLGVEPTTTVNTGGAGYTVATLIAKIDGGTF